MTTKINSKLVMVLIINSYLSQDCQEAWPLAHTAFFVLSLVPELDYKKRSLLVENNLSRIAEWSICSDPTSLQVNDPIMNSVIFYRVAWFVCRP